jgi:hypothetical protein
MQTLFALMALAAYAMAGGSGVVTTSHRKVGWGWGCGGNCAVNTSGESETALGNDPPDVRIEDHGTLTRRESGPGGMVITATRWRYAFHGNSTAGTVRREYELRTEVGECTRTEETMDAGKTTARKQTACPGPPKRWKLACARSEVQVKGRPRPAWVCSPPEHMDAFGTEFPWVFGIEESITTVISGEPQPRTTYE